jgi:hypothetical protein
MGNPPRRRFQRGLDYVARLPHVGKGALVLMAVFVVVAIVMARQGRLHPEAAAFLAASGVTLVLFLLALYDLLVTLFRFRYADEEPPPEPLRITWRVLEDYARWLSPVGFVVGILLGHYFWP